MAKKKKEHVVFDQMLTNKKSIPFQKTNAIPPKRSDQIHTKAFHNPNSRAK